MKVTVIDKSNQYHRSIIEKLDYEEGMNNYEYVHGKWEDMSFPDESYDLILGDLVIGNLDQSQVPIFLSKIEKVLKKHGVFITKNFFINNSNRKMEIADIFLQTHINYHVYSYTINDLCTHCVSEDGKLNFSKMYRQLSRSEENGDIQRGILDQFKDIESIGNGSSFFLPTKEAWLRWISDAGLVHTERYTKDIYSRDIPVYFIRKM